MQLRPVEFPPLGPQRRARQPRSGASVRPARTAEVGLYAGRPLARHCRLLSWRFTSSQTIRLIRDGRWEKREIMYQSLHCHHQNDSCIKMGSDESHFDVSLIVRDIVTRQCPQTTTFLKRRESRSGIEPRTFCLPA